MKHSVILGVVTGLSLAGGGANAGTLDDVLARGVVNCGVSEGLTGFASEDVNGVWDGFDVAICRAVAAATLGDPSALEIVPTTAADRFTALATGDIDLLVRNSSWTFTNDASLGLDFVGINYYDGHGFMVPRELGVSSATELNEATVCIQTATTTELSLVDFFRANEIEFSPLAFDTLDRGQELYLGGECDVMTANASALAAMRATFAAPGDHVVLPEIVSKEPLGPLVRQGDDQWGDIVRWTLNALITAEELGVTSANVGELAGGPTNNAEINRLLGTEGNFGEMLGLPADWGVKAIAADGNYGELFEKNIGENTPIGLARGLNALWTDGGLLYSPPFR